MHTQAPMHLRAGARVRARAHTHTHKQWVATIQYLSQLVESKNKQANI